MRLKDLEIAATTYGATVECDSDEPRGWHVYQAVAPDGKWWRESNGPHLRVEWLQHGNWQADRDFAINDAIERMAIGYEDAGE